MREGPNNQAKSIAQNAEGSIGTQCGRGGIVRPCMRSISVENEAKTLRMGVRPNNWAKSYAEALIDLYPGWSKRQNCPMGQQGEMPRNDQKMREKFPSNCQNRAECCITINLVGFHQWQDPEILGAAREDGPCCCCQRLLLPRGDRRRGECCGNVWRRRRIR